jgi:hypothetical protein
VSINHAAQRGFGVLPRLGIGAIRAGGLLREKLAKDPLEARVGEAAGYLDQVRVDDVGRWRSDA